MSTPILPKAVWQSGTNENSIPANDNAMRDEIMLGQVISDSTTAQPSTPSDGDVYIIPDSATGTQWETFDEFDLAIYKGGTWYAFAPVEGMRVNVAGTLKYWDGSAYQVLGGLSDAPSDGTEYVRKDGSWVANSGAGGDVVGPGSATDGNLVVFDGATGKLIKDGGPPASASDNITILTESSTSTMDPATHSGRSKLILAADDVTFDSSEGYTAGDVFNVCATSALDLLVSGVTLTPPSGGTTGLSADMTVSVVMTSSTAGRIIGQTVAA